MRWRVQLGINTTSDAWKFCQNWTSHRGESNLAKFPNITSTITAISSDSRPPKFEMLDINNCF